MNSYKHEKGTFIGSGANEIFFQRWTVENPKGILVLVHGLGEHSGRYQNIVDTLNNKKISIYALDHRGHGKSKGKKGHIESFSDYTSDLKHFVNLVKEQNDKLPMIMLGHSLGGVIACKYALEYGSDIDGLILSSGGFLPATPIPVVLKTVANIFSKILPGLSLSNGLDSKGLSHDPDVIDAYENDPLVHDRVSARFGFEFMAAEEECLNRAIELTMPLMVFHGSDDPIAGLDGSKEVYEKAISADKELHVFQGLFHETMNEAGDDKKKVLEVVAAWILSHTGASKAGKAAPKKKAAAKKTASKKKAAVKKSAKKKVPAKKAAKKKAPAKKAAKKKAPTKKASAKKSSTKTKAKGKTAAKTKKKATSKKAKK